MFRNFFRKKTVRVEYINSTTGEVIAVAEMKVGQLPGSFARPTSVNIAGENWEVAKAKPVDAKEFTATGNLSLWLTKPAYINPAEVLFTIPTISNETPCLTSTALFNGFKLELHEDDWRQIEFFPISLLPIIQAEMGCVEEILFPDAKEGYEAGYGKIYVRDKIGKGHLAIPLEEFYEVAGCTSKGAIYMSIYGQAGFVENGFAFKSANYVYYGTAEQSIIKELCLEQYNSMDDEIAAIITRYNLALVNWCGGTITAI